MTEIAKNITIADWKELKTKIRSDFSSSILWNQALDIFESRLNERYIYPAKAIEDNDHITGEGFAITTLLCSLIEALETFYQGKCYKYENPRKKHEYGNGKSKLLYVTFLTQREPFSQIFTDELATDFYKNIRCALLHEAMTRNGWVIRVDTNSLIEQEKDIKTLNRGLFLIYIGKYIKNYRNIVINSKKRKKLFIRKMDCICNN